MKVSGREPRVEGTSASASRKAVGAATAARPSRPGHSNDFIDTPEKQCHGKHGYTSKAKAKLVGRRAGAPSSVKAYRCPHCDLFHLGHRA